MSLSKKLLWKFGGRRAREAMLKAELKVWRLVHIKNRSTPQECVARVRIEKPSIPRGARYHTAVMIEWTYQEENSRSLPDADTTDKMTNFERAIDPLTSENGFAELVFVRTGFGKREWLFYSCDREKFMAELNRRLANHPGYQIKISFDNDPEWDLWKDFITDIKPHMWNSDTHETEDA